MHVVSNRVVEFALKFHLTENHSVQERFLTLYWRFIVKQRYNEYSHELAEKAVMDFLDGKWTRYDILAYIEEYTGIDRYEIYKSFQTNDVNVRLEVVNSLACVVDDAIEDIINGRVPDGIYPVTIRTVKECMSGKTRKIAKLCDLHQILGHVTVLGLKPLLDSRITPNQHASIPGRGQTKLTRQVSRYLRKKSLNIKVFAKLDGCNAYGSLMYSDVIKFISKEIPNAKWIISVLNLMDDLAPDGHLIIGGYLDAWLFNLIMSYALTYVNSCYTKRRNKIHPLIVKSLTYMDDFLLLGKTKTGILKAVSALGKWMKSNISMSIKMTTNVIRLKSSSEEIYSKKNNKPSERGCPSIDMCGYQIHRTYITMRPRVVKRVIRTFLRAQEEIDKTGTIRVNRARSLVSRFGSIKQSTSKYFRKKYNVDNIIKICKRICSYHGRSDSKYRKEWIDNVVSRGRIYSVT